MAEHHRKELIGTVLSNKMAKTTVIQVTRLVRHPLFHKIIRLRKNYVAHDEKKSKIGDKVRISETKPMSKTKRWQVIEVMSSKK